MKKLFLMFVLGVFVVAGLSSFQSFSKKELHNNATDPILIAVSVDGYEGQLYFDNTTEQFISGSVSKLIPGGGGAYRLYTINSVSGSLAHLIINNQVTHFDGDIYGTSGSSISITLTLNSSNNSALMAQ
jgi:hypothetical protein